MRISDWSSDVCSSDLIGVLSRVLLFRVPPGRATDDPDDGPTPLTALINPVLEALGDERVVRKSVVLGKSVSVRVDLGGRRLIKKKHEHRSHRDSLSNTFILLCYADDTNNITNQKRN